MVVETIVDTGASTVTHTTNGRQAFSSQGQAREKEIDPTASNHQCPQSSALAFV